MHSAVMRYLKPFFQWRFSLFTVWSHYLCHAVSLNNVLLRLIIIFYILPLNLGRFFLRIIASALYEKSSPSAMCAPSS